MAEKTVQTNIILPERLWNRAKARAARDGRSFAEVVRRALAQYLMTQGGGERKGSNNVRHTGGKKIPMMVRVVYSLSEKGRIEAAKRDLPAQQNQVISFEDSEKKSFELADFYVDPEGRPSIELKKAYIHMFIEGLQFSRASLDTPILSLQDVFDYYAEESNHRRELEAELADRKQEPGA